MKFFISYKFTNIDLVKIHQTIDPIVETIKKHGHDVFCNLYFIDFYEQNNYSVKQIFTHCFDEMKTCEAYICFVDNDQIFAGGMAIEFGYAYNLRLKTIVCLPMDYHSTSVENLSDVIIHYDNNLLQQISQYL
jgi:hypothetical protein